jgi:hypothetical protein
VVTGPGGVARVGVFLKDLQAHGGGRILGGRHYRVVRVRKANKWKIMYFEMMLEARSSCQLINH